MDPFNDFLRRLQRAIRAFNNEDIYSISGRVQQTRHDLEGNLIYEGPWSKNQVTDIAANAVAAWWSGVNNTGYNPTYPPTHVELGTGTIAPAPSGPGSYLEDPVADTLLLATSITLPGTVGMVQFIFQYAPSSVLAGTYTECALLDVNGNTFCRLLENITISNTATTTLNWQVTASV